MKSFKAAATLLLLSSVSAAAADLPSRKAPAAPPPPPMWTGFYAGLNAGYGFGTNNNSSTSLWNSGSWDLYGIAPGSSHIAQASFIGGAIGSTTQGMTQSGFVGGGQIGYNMQIANSYLIGFEADIQGTTVSGSSTAYSVFGATSRNSLTASNYRGTEDGFGTIGVSAGLDYLGTARARVGYLIKPDLLLYGTGGLAYGGAWANVTTNASANTVVLNSAGTFSFPASQYFYGQNSASALLVGYSAGGGAEWMFMPNWSLKAEAIYYNLGNMNVSTNAYAAPTTGAVVNTGGAALQQLSLGGGILSGNTSVNYQGVVARAGVNYHFNFGATPVVAKF